MDINCIAIDDEPYALNQLGQMISLTGKLKLVEKFNNAFDALKFLHDKGPVDVVFCDIGMPFINGLEAGKILNSYCKFLIYVTAHRDYGAEVSELNASGYLLKPLKTTVFLEKMDNVIKQKDVRSQITSAAEQLTFIKGSLKNSYTKVDYQDIICINAQLNYVEIVTTTKTYLSYMSLNRIELNLKSRAEFIKINRSTIISMKHFDRVSGYTVYLKNKKEYTIGRSERIAFFDYLKNRLLNP